MFNLRIDITGINRFGKEPQQLDRDVGNIMEWFNRGRVGTMPLVIDKVTKSGWVWRDYQYKGGWLNPPDKRKIMGALKDWGYVVMNWPSGPIDLEEPEVVIHNVIEQGIKTEAEQRIRIREQDEQITTMQKRIMKFSSEQRSKGEPLEFHVTVGNSSDQKQAILNGNMYCIFHNYQSLTTSHRDSNHLPYYFCPRLDCGFSITLGVSDQ